MPCYNKKEQGLAKKTVTIKDLLECGAHFGHQKHRWNPKMKRYIFEERGGIYIIDLAKTMQQIRSGIEMVRETVKNRKSILFVGTKKQAKNVIRECAEDAGEFYVSERWLGGMLTNLTTIRKSVKTLERIEKRLASGGEGLTKKEISLLNKGRTKLDRNLSGIRAMRKVPGLVILVDPSREHIAVKEANKLGIPILGLVDTNCDPDPIDHVIACNDDALKSIKLILSALMQEIIDQKNEMQIATIKEEKEGETGIETVEEVEEKEKEEGEEKNE
ncbi:MAG: 30S ribosomal protein S2 [Chlamydiae bacterium]|nr:30S ribosomal protein S2 [Chlamydiota bacterium]